MIAKAITTAPRPKVSTYRTLWPVTACRASVRVSVTGRLWVDTFSPAAGGYSGAWSAAFQSALVGRGMCPLLLFFGCRDNAAEPRAVPASYRATLRGERSRPDQTSGGMSGRG